MATRAWRSLRWGAASVAVSPTSVTLAALATQQLTPVVTDSRGNVLVGWDARVTYATSNATKATVSASGLITAVATGSATITVTDASSDTATCVVTVS